MQASTGAQLRAAAHRRSGIPAGRACCPALPHCRVSRAGLCSSSSSGVADADAPAAVELPQVEQQQVSRAQAFQRRLAKHGKHMAALLPFASTALVGGGAEEMYGTLAKCLDIYSVLLTVRVLLTWFRNINWNSEPFTTLRLFTDPFLSMFRGIIPPIGGIDLSIMIGFFLLSFVSKMLKRMSFGMSPI